MGYRVEQEDERDSDGWLGNLILSRFTPLSLTPLTRLEATEAQMAKLQAKMQIELEKVAARSLELDEMERRLTESETRFEHPHAFSSSPFSFSLYSLLNLYQPTY